MFLISISSTTANTSLANYVTKANSSEPLFYGAESLDATGGSVNASYGWSANGQTIGRSNGTTIRRISLYPSKPMVAQLR